TDTQRCQGSRQDRPARPLRHQQETGGFMPRRTDSNKNKPVHEKLTAIGVRDFLLTIAQARDVLQISQAHWHELCNANVIETVRLGNRSVRVKASVINAIVQNGIPHGLLGRTRHLADQAKAKRRAAASDLRCSVPGCKERRHARSLCAKHYNSQWY